MVEGARLESVYTGNRIVGSNPTFTASNRFFGCRNKAICSASIAYPTFRPSLGEAVGQTSARLIYGQRDGSVGFEDR